MRGGSKPFKDFQRSLSRLTLSLSLARLTGTAGTTTRLVCFAQVFVHGPWMWCEAQARSLPALSSKHNSNLKIISLNKYSSPDIVSEMKPPKVRTHPLEITPSLRHIINGWHLWQRHFSHIIPMTFCTSIVVVIIPAHLRCSSYLPYPLTWSLSLNLTSSLHTRPHVLKCRNGTPILSTFCSILNVILDVPI